MPKKGRSRQSERSVKEFPEDRGSECTENLTNESPCESDWRYGRRRVESNWGKYEVKSEAEEHEQKAETGFKSDDFENLLNSSSDCNYFQFKSEKNWESESVNSNFVGHKFFNLNLELLSSGLACIPFYERVGIEKNMLSQSDIEKCDKKAKESQVAYKAISENFLKELARTYELPEVNRSSPVNRRGSEDAANDNDRPMLSEGDSVFAKCDSPQDLLTEKELPVISKTYLKNEVDGKLINNNDENLEDWLDSVLDD